MDETDHYAQVYAERAADYEALTVREDYQSNLPAALAQIRQADDLDIVDLGTGTGRLACMLAPAARSMAAFDASAHMLEIAVRKLRTSGLHNWHAAVADHRAIPLPDASADLVVSGWSVVYTVVWYQDAWQRELNRALEEIERILRPGGTVIIMETMGTGYATPTPPEDLHEYFDYLGSVGFESTWIRTDYAFPTLAEAQTLASFFFGEETAERVVGTDPVILPECTGIWWK